jgi:hypothetical protein
MILIPLSVEKCVLFHRFGATALPSDLLHSTKSNLYFDTYPRMKAGKNTSTVILASRKRRQKGNRISPR